MPGHRAERFAKALASGADAVIIDLEDAVPLEAKQLARDAIRQAWEHFSDAEKSRLLVRINPVDSAFHADDTALLALLPGLGAVVLPKAESAASLQMLTRQCPGLAILPLLESAEGFFQLDGIAAAPYVLRLGLGHVDLQADLGISCGPDEVELAVARWTLVVASRRAGLPQPVDGITTSTTDSEVIVRDTQRSRRFGFGSKLCIHPAQVPFVHQGFAATDAELAWARRVLDASRQAGGGAINVDGKMVDAPVLALASQILQRSVAA